MYVLKDTECSICGSDIEAISYTGYNEKTLKKETVVSHCACVNCGKNVIVSQDDFKSFITRNCISKY